MPPWPSLTSLVTLSQSPLTLRWPRAVFAGRGGVSLCSHSSPWRACPVSCQRLMPPDFSPSAQPGKPIPSPPSEPSWGGVPHRTYKLESRLLPVSPGRHPPPALPSPQTYPSHLSLVSGNNSSVLLAFRPQPLGVALIPLFPSHPTSAIGWVSSQEISRTQTLHIP